MRIAVVATAISSFIVGLAISDNANASIRQSTPIAAAL
jgi:hypothetical protein